MANTKEQEWTELAARLESVAEDVMNHAAMTNDLFDEHIVQLWSRSIYHCAIEMRFFAGEEQGIAEASRAARG